MLESLKAQKVALELMATENEVKGLKTRMHDVQGSLFEARAQIKAYEPQPPVATAARWSLCRAGTS